MPDELSANLAALRIDRGNTARPASHRGVRWLAWVVVVGLAGVSVAWVLPRLEATIFKTAVEVTEIAQVSPAQSSVELVATGYVQADRTSNVAPKVPGRVLVVHVRQGQKVEAGSALIELDPTDDEAAILAARSQVAAARAQGTGAAARVATAQAQLSEIQLQAKRERLLANKGVTARSVAEDLEARVVSLQQQVGAALAEQKAAVAHAAALGSQVKVLQVGLRNLTLTAPIDGTVVNKPPQIGEFVGPQPAGISVDMGGIRIADFSTLLVETDIPETRLAQVRPGGPVEIVLDAFPNKRLRGAVKEITPEVDRAKATVMVKVALVDKMEGVLPDMSARVSFLTEALDVEALKKPPLTVVPGSAVTERGGSKVVFVVEGSLARMVAIELGKPFGRGFEVIVGPRPGTRVVASPGATLKDGQKIKESTAD